MKVKHAVPVNDLAPTLEVLVISVETGCRFRRKHSPIPSLALFLGRLLCALNASTDVLSEEAGSNGR